MLEGEVTEYEDGGNGQFDSDYIFFGWVKGDADEYGYFRLSELESVKEGHSIFALSVTFTLSVQDIYRSKEEYRY